MYDNHSWSAVKMGRIFLSEHSLIITVWILKNPGVREKVTYDGY